MEIIHGGVELEVVTTMITTPSNFTPKDRRMLLEEFRNLSILSKIEIKLGMKVFISNIKGLKFYAWRCKDCGKIAISYVQGFGRYLVCKFCHENARLIRMGAHFVEGVVHSTDASMWLGV